MSDNKNKGVEAEYLFKEMLDEHNIKYDYVNSWYDFNVRKLSNETFGLIVDVKSARISHKCTSKRVNQSYAIGRFHFTEEQINNKIWVALYIRWDEQYIFTGFLKLNGTNHKYLSIHKLREENLLSLNEFKEILRGK